MTRETKLGLVVACTFLCLLGAVLYIKWSEPTGGNQDTSFARADGVVPEVPADPKPVPAGEAPATTIGSDNPSTGAAPALPASAHHDPLVTRASADTASSTNDPDKKPAEPAPLSPQPPSNTFAKDAPAPIFPTSATDANPPRDEKNSSPLVAPLPNSLSAELKDNSGNQSKDEKHPAEAPAFPAPMPATGSADHGKPDLPVPVPASRSDENDKPNVPAPLPSTELPVPTPPSGAGFTPAPLPGETRPERPTTDTSGDHRPAPLPFPPKPDPAPGTAGLIPEHPSDVNPSAADKSGPGLTGKPSDTTPIPDRPEGAGTNSATTPALGSGQPSRNGDSWDRPEATPGVPPLGKPSPAAPQPSPTASNPIMGAQNDHQGRIGASADRSASADSLRPYPPLGMPAAGTSPAIAVPAPTGAIRSASATLPHVDSYDEQTHVSAQGDTFESISMKWYGTTELAAALMQFNHTHPRAAAPMLQNPPTLVSGVAVYIPPARILQNQFNVPGNAPKSSVPVATTGAGKLPSEPAKPGTGLQYKVRRGDEMIPLIARDVLGNVDRWTEIYQLNNRSFDPSRPLPAGTVLALPADAKVPPENAP